MSVNLAEDAVHALNRAAAAAARDDAGLVEPRHLLAGVASQRDPALAELVRRADLDLDDLPSALRDLPVTHENHIPFSSASQDVLAAAVDLGATTGAPTASVHLLLAVADADDQESQRVLADWGLEAARLRAVLAAASSESE